ncbi:MAG: C1 family peptidase [Clostridium sp.]|jgi:hypothetical protein|nr:C1 family peptidase [Clostridium sp.]
MFRFIFSKSKVRLLPGLLALLVVALSFSIIFTPTQTSASTLHPTGLIMEDEIPHFVFPALTLDTYNLPSYVDFSYYYPYPGDQGRLGSCVAFATGYAALTYKKAFEVQLNRNYNNYFEDDNNIFSPSFIYNQIHFNDSPSGGGATFSSALNLLMNKGCVSLAEMPYSGELGDYNTMPTESQLEAALENRIFRWEYLPAGNVEQIKARLVETNPVVIGVPVYPDFDNISPGNDTYDDLSGYSRGGHALCLVGYDDNKQAFKFINSWGTDWGLDGFGWISYDLIEELRVQPYSFPVAPSDFRMTNSGGLTIEFKWDSIPGKSYAVYRRPTGSAEEPAKLVETGTNNKVIVQTPFGSYDYSVAIVDEYGNRLSGFSRFCTVRRYQSAPTNFRLLNSLNQLVKFTWDSVPGKSYAVYRRPTGSTEEPAKVIELGEFDSAIIQTPFGSYDYCVAIVDEYGNRTSEFSNFVTFER